MTHRPLLSWVQTQEAFPGIYAEWKLMFRNRCVATVWGNGFRRATWHTWDRNGVGGENDVEEAMTDKDAVRKAKIEASASAIFQGFI